MVKDIIEGKMLNADRIAALRCRDFSLALCHGNFDLVHPGHLAHFEFARSFGDRLVISVNDDVSCRASNKGPGRPLLNERERAYNLASLLQVDWVFICAASTPDTLMRQLEPEFYVKGIEYAPRNYGADIPETAIVESYGGKMIFGPEGYVHSSRKLTGAYVAEA